MNDHIGALLALTVGVAWLLIGVLVFAMCRVSAEADRAAERAREVRR